MNRKNILLILTGIFLISMRFFISIAGMRFDIAHDTIGFLLIIFALNGMKSRNSLFKKTFFIAIGGFIASIAGQFINCVSWESGADTMYSISIGLTVIFAIYLCYYFTEALILESKVQSREAVTRNYRITWLAFAALTFGQFIIFKSEISGLAILAQALVGVASIYYCVTVFSTSRQLYED